MSLSKIVSSDRDHALDATRAAALLLGVLFHAAWSFVPFNVGAAIVDPAANDFFGWFFFASHTFRMQLFFLIAGFFGRLVFVRKGYRRFILHRLQRIAVPFLLGWVILFPLYLVARALCHRVAVGIPLDWEMVAATYHRLFLDGLIWIPRSEGGAFGLAHLWFLYFLLWFYLLMLLSGFLMQRFISERMYRRIDALTAWVMKAPWSVFLLALVFGVLMYEMEGWFGVTTPLHSLVPFFPSFFLYGAFFTFGWVLHRQAELLRFATHRWLWQIPAGCVLTVVLNTTYVKMVDEEKVSTAYPRITPPHITDWPQFPDQLNMPASGDHRILEALHQKMMGGDSASLLLNLSDRPSLVDKVRVCTVINRAMETPSGSGIRGENMPLTDLLLYNRKPLGAALAGMLVPDPMTWRGYLPIRAAYSVCYALATWLLVLGSLNLFQARFVHYNPIWRYLADSSYWVYLIHLPVVVALQGWVAPLPYPAALKFGMILVCSSLILFGSYHYFVRSTFVGKLLNGRAYPFVPWPFSCQTTFRK